MIIIILGIGNCCSMVWAHRQGQRKRRNFSLSFSEEAAKMLCLVYNAFLDVIFYSHILVYNSFGYRKLSKCQHVLLLDDLALLLLHLDI